MTRDTREWLETDGLGGYAMGTAAGLRLRRYHGLLVAAVRPPSGRMLLVAGLEVFAETSHGRFALSSNQYADVVYPDGAERVVDVSWQPWPRWEFALPGGIRISQEYVMPRGAPRVVIRWRLLDGNAVVRLWVRPLLAGRDHHALHHENPACRFDAERSGRRVTWRLYPGVPSIDAVASGDYHHAPDWYRRFHYPLEAERGLDCEEDLASPGFFTMDLAKDAALVFTAGALNRVPPPADEDDDAMGLATRLMGEEASRRAGFVTTLARAADHYLVARGGGTSVIAGYPWFGEWGRDTFVSLRGLCLATGRVADALGILLEWSRALSDGMLPNCVPESGAPPTFNSVDAALWFVVSADAFLAVAPCTAANRRELEDAIDAIVATYERGTQYRIGADTDGLLACGVPGVALTWMDARVGERVVTPRIGKPIEVQALWVNALAIAGRRHPQWQRLCDRARAGVAERFWNPERRMLFDVVDCDHEPGSVDPAMRPNQIFAVGGGLPLAVVDGDRARAVVDAVERELWTPAGLRSLGPSEPGYCPRYEGGPAERDGAYHQGTVWTWLAGPFVEAWVRVRGGGDEVQREAHRRFIAPLLATTGGSSVGHLAEIADGEPPHTARGCPFQAWSVAEALRLAH